MPFRQHYREELSLQKPLRFNYRFASPPLRIVRGYISFGVLQKLDCGMYGFNICFQEFSPLLDQIS